MSAADLSPTPPTQIARPVTDKVLTIALGLVAILGAAEIAGVAVHYIGRARDRYTAANPKVTKVAAPVAAPKATAAPVQGTTAAAPGETKSGPSTTVASPTERLLKEAIELRDKGDTTNALARLQDATQRDPKNAEVLATMALIYESIQLFERSNETWQKVQALGPTAGTFYEMADLKLKGGASAPATTTTGPGSTSVSAPDAASTGTDTGTIPDGATLAITEVRATDVPDPDAETNMKLRISVKSRPNTAIDHTKVKIQVFFYDTLDNRDVILTDADVSFEWLTPNHDWKDTDTEILVVTYLRGKKTTSPDAALTAAAAAVTPGGKKKSSSKKDPAADPPVEEGHRKYLGYIVRVYYNDQLQNVKADPARLLNLFPPPVTAPQ